MGFRLQEITGFNRFVLKMTTVCMSVCLSTYNWGSMDKNSCNCYTVSGCNTGSITFFKGKRDYLAIFLPMMGSDCTLKISEHPETNKQTEKSYICSLIFLKSSKSCKATESPSAIRLQLSAPPPMNLCSEKLRMFNICTFIQSGLNLLL